MGFAGFIQAFDDVCTMIYESPMGQAEAAKGGTPAEVVGRVMKAIGKRNSQARQANYGL